LLWR